MDWKNNLIHENIKLLIILSEGGNMRISKLFLVVIFSWFIGIFTTATSFSAQELCTECLSKVPKDMRD